MLFCFLRAFSTDRWDEYGGAQPSRPKAENSCPHSSASPHRRVINHYCLPVSVRTLCFPCLCLSFFIPSMQLSFRIPNFKDSHGTDPYCSSWGWSYHASVICWRVAICSLWKYNAESVRNLISQLPHSKLGNSTTLRHHPFFLWPGGSSDHNIIPEILPHFTPVSQAHPSLIVNF